VLIAQAFAGAAGEPTNPGVGALPAHDRVQALDLGGGCVEEAFDQGRLLQPGKVEEAQPFL
jgi:hypothetical protein